MSRLIRWLVLAPLAVATLAAGWHVGATRRGEREARDLALAERAGAAYQDALARMTERGGGRAGDPGLPEAVAAAVLEAEPVADSAGYDMVAYLGAEPLLDANVGEPPRDLVADLASTDAPVAGRYGGRQVAVVPLKDADRWEIVGALVVQDPAPAPPRLPVWVLLIGGTGLLLTWLAGRLREGPLLLVPGAAALAVVAALAPSAATGVVIAAAAWLVVAGIGVSLLGLAGTPLALREAGSGWAFLAPSLAHLLVFSVGPILFALWLSFHEWSLVDPARPFVGLANYAALAGDEAFLRAVRNTAVYVLFVPVGMVVALGLALLVNRPFRGVRVLRAIFFLPYITSFVAISLVWKWMYEPDFGLFNTALAALGLPQGAWLDSPATALPSLMLMSVWMYSGYMMVIFLAGLQSIPESLYESARIDGASAWQRFRHITLPLLRPTTFFILVTMIIFMFQVFTAVYVMTEGGPLHATDVMVYHIYRSAWEYLRMGYASAMAWVLFAIVFLLTLVQWRWLGRERPT